MAPASSSKQPNIVVFAGGTGIRLIHRALAENAHVTRVVPVSDNGGSSRQLREQFHLLPVGDLRHALMTVADSEGVPREVIRLFNWRLPAHGTQAVLQQEFQSFCMGKHPLMQTLPKVLRKNLQEYLSVFWHGARGMRLAGGSLGNFIMVGAYQVHGHINSAVFALQQLLGLNASVWPVSLSHDLQLSAKLANGAEIRGQSAVTSIDRRKITAKIIAMSYDQYTREPEINPMVADVIEQADMILFGPGSFFTSVMPHVLVHGLMQTIAKKSVPKIFIGNMVEDNECYGYQLYELLRYFLDKAEKITHTKNKGGILLSHVLANQPYTRNDGHHVYLEPGNRIRQLQRKGVDVIMRDFEDPWRRGHHDPEMIASMVMELYNTGRQHRYKAG